jgi:hypothetical protein
VRNEPVTSSRYHQHRMEALLSAMKRQSCISGKIVDYFWRDEFQQRGTPHTHMAVYVKNAPVLGVNSDQEICDFADRYVATSSERASVENLEAQQHQHSKRYCLRKSAVGNSLYCRFGFPKVPMLKTIIIRPLPLDLPNEDRRKDERTFEKIRKTVKRLDDLQQKRSGSERVVWEREYPSFDAFLRGMELSWSDFVLGLRSSVQKATIFYKRDLDAIRRNPYNEKILAMQNSNMDAQFVLDPYSAATYISSYMMKSNYALSKLMMDACATICDAGGSAGDVMRAMGNALLNGQEISVQHAAYVCTGSPFRGSSRETAFIPSAAPAERAFLVKQDWELKRLPSDSTDFIAFSLVDKYACRTSNPQLHELGADDVCLADFAALFSPVQHRQADNENDDADVSEGSELQGDFAAAEQVSLSTISDFGRRRYHKRAEERVIRYVHYKLNDDPEAYYRKQLLLYYP